MQLRVAIIDDEKKAREATRKLLQLYCPYVVVIGEAEDIQSGINLIQDHKPDVVLLDIKLRNGTGFNILEKFLNPTFKVIFITAYNEFALKAFKYSALDYVLKPLDPDELSRAIEKCRERISTDSFQKQFDVFASHFQPFAMKKRIALRTEESMHVVEIAHIIHCVADKNYTTVHLIDNKEVLVSRPLKEFDEMLNSMDFFRIHQSHLINLDHLLRFEKRDGGFVVMKEGVTLPVASRKKAELIAILGRM
ncbi:MAG: LytTR family DNA-binding domain-containing protein [Saprospiraceae bacterium]|nr:LytTR family DNA-binding domain-containing protein [Saprospiraceae bacterium]